MWTYDLKELIGKCSCGRYKPKVVKIIKSALIKVNKILIEIVSTNYLMNKKLWVYFIAKPTTKINSPEQHNSYFDHSNDSANQCVVNMKKKSFAQKLI